MRRLFALLAISVLFFAACGNDDDTGEEATPEAPAATEEPAPVTTPAPVDDTPVEEPVAEEPAPEPIEESTPTPAEEPIPIPESTAEPLDPPEPIDFSNPAFTSADKLSTAGLGNMFFGMTPDEAGQSLPTLWAGGPEDGTPRCYLLAPANGPAGVVVTIYNSSIERVDITNPSITTRSGASVGSTEAQLHELFGERLVVNPYADGSGNSIQYVPLDEPDVDYRVIWETDGTSVTSIRAGRLPAVAPAEPCT
ncbi:MAG: hypothetical protein OXF99_08825 [bacterium]|nr:hypothetical protein [bacterium]